jgi:hypothetical protein
MVTMTFIQIIEYETRRAEELDALMDEWVTATEGKRTATHETHAKDRDQPGHYVDIVEFPSYELAMRNSEMPETRRIAGKMRELCTGETRFLNLDVVREEALAGSSA